MATQKFLLIYRNPAEDTASDPSPAEMQQIMQQWMAWKERFKSEIVDLGDGLRPGGKVVRKGKISDGPYLEAKEVLGGYSIIEAAGIDRAAEISRSCPVLAIPGASVEVRELAGF